MNLSRTRCPRLPLALTVVAGIVVSVILHRYFVKNYIERPRAEASVQRAENSSGAKFSLLLKDRAACFLLLGAVVPIFARRTPWCAALAFTAGVGLTHAALAVKPPLSNLWPIVMLLIVAVTAGPALVGSGITAFLLSSDDEQGKHDEHSRE